MTTTTSTLPQPYRFGRILGWNLFLIGWICFAYFIPEAWLKQFEYGLVVWKLLAACMWLAGWALLLYPKSWPAWLKLLLLAVLGSLLGMGVYYTYRGLLAQKVIDSYLQSRPAR